MADWIDRMNEQLERAESFELNVSEEKGEPKPKKLRKDYLNMTV